MEFRKIEDVVVSNFDEHCYKLIRENVKKFLKESAEQYDATTIRVLDIAPQIHEGAKAYFKKALVETLDVDESSGATYIADITKYNEFLSSEYFDVIVCTEVLEHTLNPFKAIEEIYRLLKPSGVLLLSVPLNFRIHGPLPDCWRFTKFGLEVLLKDFTKVEINSLETEERDLMPVHYTVKAIK